MADTTLDDIPDKPDEEKEKEEKDTPQVPQVTDKKKEKQWVEDKHESEILKLQVGESVEGLLTDKYPSTKWNAQIYKIKVKDDELPKVIVGTTILDKMMKNKEVGDPVKIERLADGKSTKGKPLQNWKTYHLE